MKSIPWRLIGLGVLVIAAGLLVWRVTAWRAGYLERDQAIADLAALHGAVAAREADMQRDREADSARRAALSLALENARAAIEVLRAHPIVSVVYREKPAKNGKCDDPRIGPDWIGVYNDTADAATRAVSRPD